MNGEMQAEECQEQLDKLNGRKVVECSFKTYENKCWRLYIVTDEGKLVMTFCPDWTCPVVEHHEAHHEKISDDL
ncbi:hypothetical protein J2743_001947 [Methanobacterium petrolearium]|nr:hypothetical protein [Methanobacterium petrolearium]BDZ72191.1 hypothetical protein GCM10025861_27080 [Methanobacterium petrolearium]